MTTSALGPRRRGWRRPVNAAGRPGRVARSADQGGAVALGCVRVRPRARSKV